MNMQGRIFLFNIGRVPVVAHPTYLVLVLLCLTAYRWAPPSQMLALGFVYLIGVTLSIILHELGHTGMGLVFGIRSTAIEINGLGGLAYLQREPPKRWQSIAISLAGPAVNLALYLLAMLLAWMLLQWNMSAIEAGDADDPYIPYGVYQALGDFQFANGFMFLFNLLPAFPLDGGRALRQLISGFTRDLVALHAVAVLGMLTGFAILGLSQRYGYGMIYLGLYMMLENWQVYQSTR